MKDSARRGLFFATLLVGAGYVAALVPTVPESVGPWLLAVGAAGAMVSAMALGAAGDGGLGGLGPVFLLVFVVLVGGLCAPLLVDLSPSGPGSGLLLGLPPGAAVVVYGVGLLPVLLVPLAYAVTFRHEPPGEDRATGEREAPGPSGGEGP